MPDRTCWSGDLPTILDLPPPPGAGDLRRGSRLHPASSYVAMRSRPTPASLGRTAPSPCDGAPAAYVHPAPPRSASSGGRPIAGPAPARAAGGRTLFSRRPACRRARRGIPPRRWRFERSRGSRDGPTSCRVSARRRSPPPDSAPAPAPTSVRCHACERAPAPALWSHPHLPGPSPARRCRRTGGCQAVDPDDGSSSHHAPGR